MSASERFDIGISVQMRIRVLFFHASYAIDLVYCGTYIHMLVTNEESYTAYTLMRQLVPYISRMV